MEGSEDVPKVPYNSNPSHFIVIASFILPYSHRGGNPTTALGASGG